MDKKESSVCCDEDDSKSSTSTNPGINVLVGVTGSVAAIKVPELVAKLNNLPQVSKVAVVTTEHACKFFSSDELGSTIKLWRDEDEWSMWNGRGDPVLHIDLGKWADVLVIAPLDANTLAKIAGGQCDNLLTCILRAWDLKSVPAKPVLFCPAMNTKMWEHPLTAGQISTLCGFGYQLVEPVEKTLMCGDKGVGAMAHVDTIVSSFMSVMKKLV